MKKTIFLAVMSDGTVVRNVPFDRHFYAPEADLIITRGEDGTLEVWKDRYGTRATGWTITSAEAETRLQYFLQRQAAK